MLRCEWVKSGITSQDMWHAGYEAAMAQHVIDWNQVLVVTIPVVGAIILVLVAVIACYIRAKYMKDIAQQGMLKLDNYKRWSRKLDKQMGDKAPVQDSKTNKELEKLIKKLIKEELINMMK